MSALPTVSGRYYGKLIEASDSQKRPKLNRLRVQAVVCRSPSALQHSRIPGLEWNAFFLCPFQILILKIIINTLNQFKADS